MNKTDRLFQVLKNGVPMFGCFHLSCVPSKEEIKQLKSAGYTVIDNRGKIKPLPEPK